MKTKTRTVNSLLYVILIITAVLYIVPIALVVMNSFKGKLFINTAPFTFPNAESFVGGSNYVEGLKKIHFGQTVGSSFFITIVSVILIVVFCPMSAWILTRIKARWTSLLYLVFAAQMVVPFQMIMYTLTKTADTLHLNNLVGICFIYLGTGTGMANFIAAGFIRTIPLELEEAALIDGCTPVQTYFNIVYPILKPIRVTIAILNAMWIWNDYLLPYLVIGGKFHTIPIAVQNLRSAYGSIDYGHMMAIIVVALIPVTIFYFSCQKYIVDGIVTGAVKG